jgi:hypothetical protein
LRSRMRGTESYRTTDEENGKHYTGKARHIFRFHFECPRAQ